MPYITIEGGELSPSQTEDLIKQITEVSSKIMKIPSDFFMVTIKELPDNNIGIAGKTIDKVKAEYIKSNK